jgi:hypothetical protein
MMHVGYMRMPVPHLGMPQRMHIRPAGRVVRQMLMLMVLVTNVSMRAPSVSRGTQAQQDMT